MCSPRSEVWAVDFQNGNLDTCFSVHDIFYFVNVSFLTSDIYMCTTNVPSRYECLLETKIDESRIGRGQWTGGVRCTEKAKQRLKVRLIFCASRAAL